MDLWRGRDTGRTLDVHNVEQSRVSPMSTVEPRRRSRRLELRTTASERDLIERAAAACDANVTEFVVDNAVNAARRVLANRDRFEMSAEALAEWETINARRPRDLPGLRRLMQRPSPFKE